MAQLTVIDGRKDGNNHSKKQKQKKLNLLASGLLSKQSLSTVKLFILSRLIEQVEINAAMSVCLLLVTKSTIGEAEILMYAGKPGRYLIRRTSVVGCEM